MPNDDLPPPDLTERTNGGGGSPGCPSLSRTIGGWGGGGGGKKSGGCLGRGAGGVEVGACSRELNRETAEAGIHIKRTRVTALSVSALGKKEEIDGVKTCSRV